jgi:hypothetical protein
LAPAQHNVSVLPPAAPPGRSCCCDLPPAAMGWVRHRGMGEPQPAAMAAPRVPPPPLVQGQWTLRGSPPHHMLLLHRCPAPGLTSPGEGCGVTRAANPPPQATHIHIHTHAQGRSQPSRCGPVSQVRCAVPGQRGSTAQSNTPVKHSQRPAQAPGAVPPTCSRASVCPCCSCCCWRAALPGERARWREWELL